MIATCATHIPLPALPAHVAVSRHGRPVTAPTGARAGAGLLLQTGDDIRVGRLGMLVLSYAGNRYRVTHGEVRLDCRDLALAPGSNPALSRALAVRVLSGRVQVRSGTRARRALVLSPEMLAFATAPDTNFVVARSPAVRSTSAWTRGPPLIAAGTRDQTLRIRVRLTYTAIADRKGLRLDVWPFALSRFQRADARADRLPPYWGDGLPCSVGCTAAGAIPGWPLKPFHQQHAIRAGINELRPANFHVAVDIEANNSQPVYAIQSGYASIRYPGTADVNVDVGRILLLAHPADRHQWAICGRVQDRDRPGPVRLLPRRVVGGQHIGLPEPAQARRQPASLHDTDPPVIGVPHVFADGRVIVGAFDPQSFVQTGSLRDARARALVARVAAVRRPRPGAHRAEWAMRGSQNYPPGSEAGHLRARRLEPGIRVLLHQGRCIPNWVYWLAGGLTPSLPLGSLRLVVTGSPSTPGIGPGTRRRSITGSSSRWRSRGRRTSGEFGPLAPQFDYP